MNPPTRAGTDYSIPSTSLGRYNDGSGMNVTISIIGKCLSVSHFIVGTTCLSSVSLLTPAAM